MRSILLIFFILAGLCRTEAQEEEASPKEIFENAVRHLSISDARLLMNMETTDQKGNSKTRELHASFAGIDETKKVMIEITAPDNLKGTKVLSTRQQEGSGIIQVYMPSTGKTRKFRANNRNMSRLGNKIPAGHFNTSSYTRYKAISIGKEQIKGVACHKIHLRPEEENTYGIAYVTVKGEQLIKVEQYDQNARMTGLTELSEYRSTNLPGNKFYPRKIKIRETETDEKTEITITDIKSITDPEELDFKMPGN
ncbi:MAG: outer membrane lipoprotein-sorting protein [Bacteroidota bacterium]